MQSIAKVSAEVGQFQLVQQALQTAQTLVIANPIATETALEIAVALAKAGQIDQALAIADKERLIAKAWFLEDIGYGLMEAGPSQQSANNWESLLTAAAKIKKRIESFKDLAWALMSAGQSFTLFRLEGHLLIIGNKINEKLKLF